MRLGRGEVATSTAASGASHLTMSARTPIVGAMGAIQRKNLDSPDSIRRFPRGVGSLAQVGALAIGRAQLEPGWRWSIDVKPDVGTASCQVHHLQILLDGRLAIEMDDGEHEEFGPGDVFDVPPGHDAWVVGDERVVLFDVFGNVADFAVPSSPRGVVATVLMTDIVDSTATASRMGDGAWNQALANHNRVIRGQLERFRGHEVNTTGDGFLATFDSAVAAVHCGAAIGAAVRQLGLEVRVGIHTGEIEVLPDDIRGIAVHAAARIMTLAGPSEVVVSAVTRALTEGSGLRYEDLGRHELKGLGAPMEVFRLEAE